MVLRRGKIGRIDADEGICMNTFIILLKKHSTTMAECFFCEDHCPPPIIASNGP